MYAFTNILRSRGPALKKERKKERRKKEERKKKERKKERVEKSLFLLKALAPAKQVEKVSMGSISMKLCREGPVLTDFVRCQYHKHYSDLASQTTGFKQKEFIGYSSITRSSLIGCCKSHDLF